MHETEHMLYQKISVPPKMEKMLERPELNALIDQAVQKPLVIVSAGAGFGKTHAVSYLLDHSKYHVVWLQLSDLDNLCARLWERLVYAYGSWDESLGDALKILGFPITAQAFDQYLRLVAQALKDDQKWVFVLDDFHCINDPEIMRFVERFAVSQLHNHSLVIVSRTQPDISVAAMESKGLLSRISESQLRFSSQEMQDYFSVIGFDLTPEKAAKLYQYTDGWAIAIFLTGLALQNGEQFGTDLPASAQADLFSMIEKEIFIGCSDQLQTLLIRASLLNNLSEPLLHQLAQDNQALVNEFLKTSLLTRDGTFASSLRFHHLLQEFLKGKQHLLSREEREKTYLIAADWYDQVGLDLDALQYYVQCDHYQQAYDIILRYSNRVPAEIASFFIEIIEKSPPQFLQERPIMQVVRAKYILNNGGVQEAYAECAALRQKYESLPPTPENVEMLGEIYLFFGILCFIGKSLEFPKLFEMADKCLPGGSSILDNKMMLVNGYSFCIIKEKGEGELQKLQDAFCAGMPFASRVMNGCGYGLEHLVAGEAAYFTTDMKTAEEKAHLAISCARKYNQLDIEYAASYILMRIYICRGDCEKIIALLRELKAKEVHMQEYISIYDVVEAAFLCQIRRQDKMPTWIKYDTEANEKNAPISITMDSTARACYLLLERRYCELLALTEQSLPIFEARGVLIGSVCHYILKALAHHGLGQNKEAMQALYCSYDLSYRNHIIMPHVEFGAHMRALIQTVSKEKDCPIPRQWLDMICTKASTQRKRQLKLQMEYNLLEGESAPVMLSKRESDVLWDLCQGLTQGEIAQSCGLSVNTVKSMLRSIYGKLGATNALDAIRIASKKNLI